jgi:hypothetical protein
MLGGFGTLGKGIGKYIKSDTFVNKVLDSVFYIGNFRALGLSFLHEGVLSKPSSKTRIRYIAVQYAFMLSFLIVFTFISIQLPVPFSL